MTVYLKDGLPIRNELEVEGLKVKWKSDLLAEPPQEPMLKILIVNLMPTKDTTKKQLLRLIGNQSDSIDVDLLYMTSHQSKNVSLDYLAKYYLTFNSIKDNFYDGIIFTGAPVEHLPYEEVNYYNELVELFNWSIDHSNKRLFICWGAQFALNYQYGIDKEQLQEKVFGIYEYEITQSNHPLFEGFENTYFIPQSRHTQLDDQQIESTPDLNILSYNKQLGIDILQSKNRKDVYILGHLEYDRETLANEYERDLQRGEEIQLPKNYFPGDDPSQRPKQIWRNSAQLFYGNWVKGLLAK